MNHFMQEKWPWIEGTHGMRSQLLDILNDTDLAFSPGGQNKRLGEMLCEVGEIEYSYVQSLKTLKQDWSYRNTTPGVQNHISQLKAWYQALDEEMKATISALSDEDAAKTIDRDGFAMPVELQLDVYLQALLIIVTHCERHIVSDITCLIISRTPTKIHILRSGLEWSVECLPENTTDRPPYIISKIMPILVNCDDAGTSIEHVGPLRLLVPMHFTHTTGSQAYIYACQCRCK